MWRIEVKKGYFKEEGYCTLIIEDCPNPLCDREELRYPYGWVQGATCPHCKTPLPAKYILKTQWGRKHYFCGLESTAVGKLLLCTP